MVDCDLSVTNIKRSNDLKNLVFFGFLGVSMSALATLHFVVNEVFFWTPYVAFIPVAVLIILIWLLRPKKFIVRSEEWAFLAAQGLVVVSSLLSLWSRDAFGKCLFAFYTAGLYVAARYSFKSGLLRKGDLKYIAYLIFILLSFVALLQLVTHTNIGVVATYFGQNLNQGYYWEGGSFLRVSGTFVSANVFAVVYSTYGAIVIAWNLFDSGRQNVRGAFLISLIMTILVISSLSRGGVMYAMLAQAIIYGVWARRSKGRFNRVVGIGIPVISVLLMGAMLFLTFSSGAIAALSRFTMSQGEGTRINLIVAALKLLQHPAVALFGVGSGQFFVAVSHYGIPLSYDSWKPLVDVHASVHNFPMQMSAESGIPAFLLFAYAIIKTVTKAYKLKRCVDGELVAVIGLIVFSLYVTDLQLDTSGTTPWVLTPVVLVIAWIQNEIDKNRSHAQ